MVNKTARARGANFSLIEIDRMLHLINQHVSVVEAKASDIRMWNLKSRTWQTIADDFNSESKVFRSCDQLKTKYEALKKVVRSKCFKIKQGLDNIGEGPAVEIELTAQEEKIKDMLGPNIDLTVSRQDPGYLAWREEQADEGVSLQAEAESSLWEKYCCVTSVDTRSAPSPQLRESSVKRKSPSDDTDLNFETTPSLVNEDQIAASAQSSSSSTKATVLANGKRFSRYKKRKKLFDVAKQQVQLLEKELELAEMEIKLKKQEFEFKKHEFEFKKQEFEFKKEENKLKIRLLEMEVVHKAELTNN